MATSDWDRLKGYSYCEHRALSNFAGKRYLPFQHLGERLDDIEAESNAFNAPCCRAVDLMKTLKYFIAIFGWDPDSAIRDTKLYPAQVGVVIPF